MDEIVKFENVSKNISNRKILNNVPFSVTKGKFFALLGPNGAGKTTTIRLLTGLLHPQAGEIKLFNHSTDEKNNFREFIGVQNDGNLYETLTVKENLIIWGELYGMDRAAIQASIDDLLAVFDLQDRGKSQVGTLSKGMKQKVLIIRALLHQPQLLILDEPTDGLDPQTTENIISYLKKLVSKKQITIIMATHQLFGLDGIINEIAILQNGKIVETGELNSLIHKVWQHKAVKFEVDNPKMAVQLLQSDYRTEEGNGSHTLLVTCWSKEDINRIVKTLVSNEIKIFAVTELKRNLRDLYFKCMSEEQSNE